MKEMGFSCILYSVLSDYNSSDIGTVFCPVCWKPKGPDREDPDFIPGFYCQCDGDHSPVLPYCQNGTGVPYAV